MRTINLIAWLAVFVSVIGIFWGIYQYPPVHDTWGHVYGVPWHDRPWVDLFLFNYFEDNPRIGQTPLMVFGGTPLGRAFLGGSSVLFLIITAFIVVLGRTPRLNQQDSLLVLWILFSLSTVGAMPGQMVYYIPYNANYILGLSILFAFLIPYRIAYDGKRLLPGIWSTIVVPLGVAAGLTNEHTVPAILLALPVLAVIKILVASRYARGETKSPFTANVKWQTAGYISLLFGYLALYFAPGQSVRYGEGRKEAGFSLLFEAFAERATSAASMLWQGTTPILLFSSLVVAVVLAKRRTTGTDKALLIATALFVGSTIAIITLASPLIAPRLIFASGFVLALAFGAVVVEGLHYIPQWRAAAIVVLTIATVGTSFGHWVSISRFASASDQRATQVREQADLGTHMVTVTSYELDKIGPASIIHLDDESSDPNHWVNKLMARQFGAEQISITPNIDN